MAGRHYPEPGALRSAAHPSVGSRAASGSGDDYLSNEAMYRVNRLRIGGGKDDLPGGHLHVSALLYPDDPAAMTSPDFEADRRATVDQAVAMVEAAGTAAPRWSSPSTSVPVDRSHGGEAQVDLVAMARGTVCLMHHLPFGGRSLATSARAGKHTTQPTADR